METAEEKYKHDPEFAALVDYMVSTIKQSQFTPSEMRRASVLACTIYEMERPLPIPMVLPKGSKLF